jgi:hypothetical protein
VSGETRVFAAASAAPLPLRSGVILGDTGPWYVDAVTGAVGRIRVQPQAVARPPLAVHPVGRGRVEPARRRSEPATAEQVIVEKPFTPVLRLTRFPCPDDRGRVQDMLGRASSPSGCRRCRRSAGAA